MYSQTVHNTVQTVLKCVLSEWVQIFTFCSEILCRFCAGQVEVSLSMSSLLRTGSCYNKAQQLKHCIWNNEKNSLSMLCLCQAYCFPETITGFFLRQNYHILWPLTLSLSSQIHNSVLRTSGSVSMTSVAQPHSLKLSSSWGELKQ